MDSQIKITNYLLFRLVKIPFNPKDEFHCPDKIIKSIIHI